MLEQLALESDRRTCTTLEEDSKTIACLLLTSDTTVVFDLAREGIQGWWFGLPGLLIAGAAYVHYSSDAHMNKRRRAFLIIGAGFGLLFFVLSSVFAVLQYSSFRRALKTGRYVQVEGLVEDFVSGRSRKPYRNESFLVDGHRISYSPSEVTGGYNKFSTPKGPIFEGQRVRVRLVGKTVVYLALLPRETSEPVPTGTRQLQR